jgi:hypothetical protein
MPASAARPPQGRGGPPCTTMSLFKEQFFGQPQRCGFEAEMWSGEGACFWFPVPDMGIRMAVWTKTRELPSSYTVHPWDFDWGSWGLEWVCGRFRPALR